MEVVARVVDAVEEVVGRPRVARPPPHAAIAAAAGTGGIAVVGEKVVDVAVGGDLAGAVAQCHGAPALVEHLDPREADVVRVAPGRVDVEAEDAPAREEEAEAGPEEQQGSVGAADPGGTT